MFKKVKKSDWILIGVFWLLLIPIIHPTFVYDEVWKKVVGVLIFSTFDTALVIVFVFYLFPKYFPQGKFLQLILGLFLLLVGQFILKDIVFWGVLGDKLTIFSSRGLMFGLIINAQNMGFFIALMIGKQFYETKNNMLALQKAQKENELRWLKAQIDPHFLFNNLNILDILIQTDPQKASIYTKRLSVLYRYLVRQKDEDVVSLREEWSFAQDYIFLLKQRFNELFVFENNLAEYDLEQYFIPPASLQILLENVVKHNIASDEAPVKVTVEVEGDFLQVSNTFKPKNIKPEGTNTGLENLEARIRLLTDQSIDINKSNGKFTVTIPLVKQVG